MSLAMFFYIADVVHGLKGILAVGLVVFFLFVVVPLIIAIMEEDIEAKEGRKYLIIVFCIMFFTGTLLIFLPSTRTIYALGAQSAMEQIAEVPEAKQIRDTLNKFLTVINKNLDEELSNED